MTAPWTLADIYGYSSTLQPLVFSYFIPYQPLSFSNCSTVLVSKSTWQNILHLIFTQMMGRNYFTVVIVMILRYMIFTFSPSVSPNRWVKYRRFTWFPGVGILRIAQNSTEIVSTKLPTPGNQVNFDIFGSELYSCVRKLYRRFCNMLMLRKMYAKILR